MAIASPQRLTPTLREAFRSRTFYLLLGGLLITKLVALLTFGHWADSDECVIGIMAKHILDRGVHPAYFYGQRYLGGASVEAHTAALFYWVFGMSGYSLKLAALVYTTAGAVALYAMTVRLAGIRAGLLALLAYATMPAMILWGVGTHGYGPMLALVPAMLLVADRMLRRDDVDHLGVIGLLVLAPFTLWNTPSVLPLVGLIVLFLCGAWVRRRQFGLLGRYAIYGAAAAAVGFWWHTQGSSNVLGALAESGPAGMARGAAARLPSILTKVSCDFFQPFLIDCVDGLSWPAPISYALFLAAIGVVVWWVCKERGRVNPIVVLILIYVPLYLICFALSSPGVVLCPRYLVPLVPAMASIMGLALARLPRWSCAAACVYLLAAFAFFSAGLIRTPRLYEHRIFYDPADIRALARTLEERGIRFVKSIYLIEWRLLFETQERVIAVNLRDPVRYPPYRQRLQQAVLKEGAPVAYVFHKDAYWTRQYLQMTPQEFVKRYLDERRVPYETADAGNYNLYVARRWR
jgi:hypothetical protein